MYDGSIPGTLINTVQISDQLPPMAVKKKTRENKRWQMAVMDSFEQIALKQFHENLTFLDYYRMIEGKMSFIELKEVLPHIDRLSDYLGDGVAIPSFLKHYDILGLIVNQLKGRLGDFEDKFVVTDTGELGKNEFLRNKDETIQKALAEAIDLELKLDLAKRGISLEGGKMSPEEYAAQLENQKQQSNLQSLKNSDYKSDAAQWGQATMDKDRLDKHLNMQSTRSKSFVDYLLTGRFINEYQVGHDRFNINKWQVIPSFFSKETDVEYPQNCSFAGTILFNTPEAFVKDYGHYMSAEQTREFLGGRENWQYYAGVGVTHNTFQESLEKNFHDTVRVPFYGAPELGWYNTLEDAFGVPLGEMTYFDEKGTQQISNTWLPRTGRNHHHGAYKNYARVLRSDFQPAENLCAAIKVYCLVWELEGYLTYEDENGLKVTEVVTEDILPEFLKEKGIKSSFKQSLEKIIDNFEINTLHWKWKPVCYEGLKLLSGNLMQPIYLYFRPCEYQVTGIDDYDVKLPLGGIIGQGIGAKIFPYQANYNLCLNQIVNMLEKEIGMFFLMDIAAIPDDAPGWGKANEALEHMVDVARSVGILPISTGEPGKQGTAFNQFATYNLSYTEQMKSRIQLAEMWKSLAYQTIGINPQELSQQTYTTAEGVKLSNEVTTTQIQTIYEDFHNAESQAWDIHLAVAQYCQSNNKDNLLFYTKSDASLAYLKISDPKFPLHRLGVISVRDPRSRKKIETIRNLMIQNNTMGTDLLNFAKIIVEGDTVQEILQVAKEARELQDQRTKLDHDRKVELEQMNINSIREDAQTKFEREKEIEQIRSQSRIAAAQITAQGRAADKDTDLTGINAINQAAEMAISRTEVENRFEIDSKKIEVSDQQHKREMDLKLEKLRQDAEALKSRERLSQDESFRSVINKN